MRPHAPPPVNRNALFFGSLPTKLELTARLMDWHADSVRLDRIAAPLLDALHDQRSRLHSVMVACGMSAACATCGTRTDGGCCGAWVAEETDALLLFVNRLMGASALARPERSNVCCFLGPAGCTLLLKPFLCVGYDCHELQSSIDSEARAHVRTLRGHLLQTYLELETRLRELV